MDWNKFIIANQGSFLQSKEWLGFQEAHGKKVIRFEFGGTNLGAIVESLPYGFKYIYLAHPAVDNLEFKKLKQVLLKLARENNAVFIRVELPFKTSVNLAESFKNDGFVLGKYLQPSHTTIVDLDGDEEMMTHMHSKTRYNIRLAAKHGVVVRKSDLSESDLDSFINLISETAERDNFFTHGVEYYKKMLEIQSVSPLPRGVGNLFSTKLYFAELNGKILAAAIVGYFGDTATYLHGASSNSNRQFMAPYALHYEIMRQARDAGYKHYDFWGVAPEGAVNHRLSGVSKFKLGFGGNRFSSGGLYELPIKKFWYKLYRFIKYKSL